jgi:IPT/TIG domain/PASTA domain
MRKLTSLVALALSSIVLITSAAAAQAAVVTLGPNLTGTYSSSSCGAPCTLANVSLAQLGAQLTSPVTGVVVRWHVLEGTTAGTYRLRTMSPLSPPSFLFTSSSEPVSSVPSAGIQTFTATMPITAGQTIALDMSSTASVGLAFSFGSFDQWEPVPADGTSPATTNNGTYGVGFNAEVQPPPVVSALGSSSGPAAGGTSVLIAGTDLENTTSVTFGGIPAAFGQVSESSLVATTPPSAAGPVLVTVKTLAGSSTAAQPFSYQNAPAASPAPAPISAPAKTCKVPTLKGKSLKASKTKIKGADCKVGKVTKLKGAKAATGKVVGQNKKPGTVLPAGTIVKVTLGKG